jgi:acetoin utilization deacetylase AcuC-like enzyme
MSSTARGARTVAWISHPSCARHFSGEGHPESPQRLQAIEDRLRALGLLDSMRRVEAPAASEAQLLRVHTREHVERVLRADLSRGPVQHDPDTLQGEHGAQAALHAAGAGIKGVELALAGAAELAFCAVRPPGHHAERARAMGFCLFNNVAVAAAHALAQGVQRVAILDFDLHYGNGTADIFAGAERVWLYSTYQHPLYPYWTGAPHASNLVDVPLPAYSGGEAFRQGVDAQWQPALERQRPELLVVSAGFDAHADDPLGDLRWSCEDYAWIGRRIRQWAQCWCPGRVVALLEGGYALHALVRSVESFLRPFLCACPP